MRHKAGNGTFTKAIGSRLKDVKRKKVIQDQMVMKELHELAMRLLSGKISLKKLKKLGHPYARLGAILRTVRDKKGHLRKVSQIGSKFVPLLPVNEQSGTLKGATKVMYRAGRVLLQITRVRYAWYVLGKHGTSKTVPRHFIEAFQAGAYRILAKYGKRL